MRRRSSGGTGAASSGLEENQGIDLSKVESLDEEATMYNMLRKDGGKEKVNVYIKVKNVMILLTKIQFNCVLKHSQY